MPTLHIDVPKGGKSPYPYAGHKIKIIEMTPDYNVTNSQKGNFRDSSSVNNIITDNAENLTPQNLNYEEMLRNNLGGNTSELKTIPTSEENATRGLPKSIINAEGLPSYIYEFYREGFKESQSFNYF